jgi:hypothetical protein
MKKLLQNIIKSCPLICSLFILCFHLQNGLAQDLNNSPKIDQKKWEKIAEKYDYSSIQKAPKKEKPTNNEIKMEPIQKAEKAENGQSNNLVSYALFALVIIALIYIGYRIIRNGQFWNNKNIVRDKVYTLENLEANLAEVDIDPFLKQALSEMTIALLSDYFISISSKACLSTILLDGEEKKQMANIWPKCERMHFIQHLNIVLVFMNLSGSTKFFPSITRLSKNQDRNLKNCKG